MNKNIVLALFGVASLALASPAFAQAGPVESASQNSSATVVVPLQLACPNTLAFGELAPQSSPTTFTVSAQGAVTDPNGISVPGSRTTAGNGGCVASGQGGLTYTVTFPASATISNGAQSMSLDTFTISSNDSNPDQDTDWTLTMIMSPNGLDTWGFGATLNVGADQAPGSYTGSFVFMAQYD